MRVHGVISEGDGPEHETGWLASVRPHLDEVSHELPAWSGQDNTMRNRCVTLQLDAFDEHGLEWPPGGVEVLGMHFDENPRRLLTFV